MLFIVMGVSLLREVQAGFHPPRYAALLKSPSPSFDHSSSLEGRRRTEATALPDWVKPQLAKLVDQPPEGPEWLHEIKFDGYRMHARLDRGSVRLLTRTGLDWTHKYPAIALVVASLLARQAYLDGELCGVRPDGTTSSA